MANPLEMIRRGLDSAALEPLKKAGKTVKDTVKKGVDTLKEDYKTFTNPITPTDKAMEEVKKAAKEKAKKILKPSPTDKQ